METGMHRDVDASRLAELTRIDQGHVEKGERREEKGREVRINRYQQ